MEKTQIKLFLSVGEIALVYSVTCLYCRLQTEYIIRVFRTAVSIKHELSATVSSVFT